MKTNRKSKNQISKFLVLLVLVALSIGGYFIWQYKFNQPKAADAAGDKNSVQKIDLNPPTTDQKAAGDVKKPVNNTPVESTTIHSAITSANVNGDLVQIRAVIDGAVSSTGSCELTLTNSGAVVTKFASTYALPASSTCQGFDINRSELSAGTWAINLTAVVGTETTTATSEIVLE